MTDDLNEAFQNNDGDQIVPRMFASRRAVRIMSCCLATGLALGASGAGAVGFVNNRTQWDNLTAEARIGYVQALNDSLNYSFVDDTLVNALAKRGRTQCLIDQNLTASMLVDLINTAYQDEQSQLLPPSAVYVLRITSICRDYINRSRQEFGLGPQ